MDRPTLDDMVQVRRRVRVLDGPLRGATYPLQGSTGIGRRVDADIQILDDGISRDHAKLVEDPRGGHWLVDLDSSNGTSVDNEQIRRQFLRPGTVFRIFETSLIYEDEPAPPRPECEEEVFAVSYHGARSRRGTIEYDVNKLKPPTGSVAEPSGEPNDNRHPITAKRADGSTYRGNLVDDLVEYRRLRLRLDRREIHDPQQLDRISSLHDALCRPFTGKAIPRHEPRYFPRFVCYVPAGLRSASGREIPVAIVELGVDGARLLSPVHKLRSSSVLWLAIELVCNGRPHTVVLTCRVVEDDGHYVNLNFCGALGRDAHEGRRPQPTLDETVPAVTVRGGKAKAGNGQSTARVRPLRRGGRHRFWGA
ncbi:MAG: FHA domain-containing protein [Myxococcota bacterium]